MKRGRIILIGGLVLILAVVAARRMQSTVSTRASKQVEETTVERQRVMEFWRLHRDAGTYRIVGNFDRAIRLYEEALMLNGDHEDALYYLGNSYLEVGRLQDAERVLTRLVTANPTSSRGHSRRGEVHLCFRDDRVFSPDRATTSFRRALEVNKEETGPMLRLAQVALIEGRVEEVRRWLEAILGTNSASFPARYLLGYVAWDNGAYAEASEQYAKALELARGTAVRDPSIGEGDRKKGSTIKPGEQLTCPTMVDLIHDVIRTSPNSGDIPTMQASYERAQRLLSDLRNLAGDSP